MIAYLYGKIVEVQVDAIIIDVNGIGYLVYCPDAMRFERKKNEWVKVFTYHYVREDIISLYGFTTEQERALFVHLLAVSGIGPKGALGILAACRPADVAAAVEREDEKYLTKFPGVGKKTARQMILDLKGKLSELGLLPAGGGDELAQAPRSTALNEAVEALESLGYGDKEIQKVIRQITGENLSANEYVKQALRLIAAQ
ncbi:MAG TPA: Holliday junction branch migration protein RuvA [Bacillales bacterium]|nr:Holliday junction branch migration protein RuvA [Bacillales bacterium]